MSNRARVTVAFCIILLSSAVGVGCSGEERDPWCYEIRDKPSAEWTVEEAKKFAVKCILVGEPG